MELDLTQEMEDQLNRLKRLADAAEIDREESYSSRASALTALSKLLADLTKTQAELINMAELQKTEQAILEIFHETATQEQKDLFLKKLKQLRKKTEENA